jgi:hypothetical protein
MFNLNSCLYHVKNGDSVPVWSTQFIGLYWIHVLSSVLADEEGTRKRNSTGILNHKIILMGITYLRPYFQKIF